MYTLESSFFKKLNECLAELTAEESFKDFNIYVKTIMLLRNQLKPFRILIKFILNKYF